MQTACPAAGGADKVRMTLMFRAFVCKLIILATLSDKRPVHQLRIDHIF
jgi:hypothetical protein